ncbi:threonyl-tRNA synthetase [Mycoemilia scoparia]|uniref:Probable threonine--tRNA ligase, cytoplasmic n=1 Tax=Mycoemilia scoparia TaxID=417184 RepID=A0A9W7ZQA8_9FUNG|nr:threonyl-tRNA synthetase [Mycoemilia scoparia]
MASLADETQQKLSIKENKQQQQQQQQKQKPKEASNKPKKSSGGNKGNAAPAGGDLHLNPQPEFIDYRVKMFEEIKQRHDAEIAQKPREPIEITLPDGSVRPGTSWETTPFEIAKSISNSLAKRLVIAKVDGELWDTTRPFEKSSKLELLDFDHPEGKMVYWHSSAHILGEACELHYGCHLCAGPPIESGFYYEMSMPENAPKATVSQQDFPVLETLAQKAIKEKQPFERLEMTKEELLEMFKYNKYKHYFINTKIPDGTKSTVYRCGPLIDLCKGPHVPDTGRIGAIAVLKNSASYFLGDANNDSLQRVYGISFPDKKQMTQHKKFLEEAAKRDHRKIGREQELFFFHDLSPGSAFFLPHGARIYNTLMTLIRENYWERGFEEVVTPNMFNVKLWQQSGHWDNYQEDMFALDVEKEKFALKPMNCPSHCLMFGLRDRSYRELPIRFADFGVLHRNEASGALTGLTRVRRFQQDDAHIFCTNDQVGAEMESCLSFLEHIYGLFGFTFELKLSTRPEKFLGEIEVWDEAERQLAAALDRSGKKWDINPGDGAFYGPKIDITIRDALNRPFQCATIQMDYQLPQRFGLEYRAPAETATTNSENTGGANNEDTAASSSTMKRPVIIHRAVLGSLERLIAILIENFAGKWPFWLSPRQIMIVPVTDKVYDYAQNTVRKQLHDAGFYVDVDVSADTLNKKIRNAELAQYNFIAVVGAQEANENSVNIRIRDDPSTKSKGQTVPLDMFIEKLGNLKKSRSLVNKLE